MRARARVWLALATLPAAGCGDASARAEPGFAVRDSAGIEIVENRGHAWARGEEWRLADTPEVDIGVVEGDSVYQLFRVAGATLLRDGRIVVANSGTGEVRFFDAAGRFLSAPGGIGEGPGEFRQMQGLWPYRGDSLLVWDPALVRATVLATDGSIARQLRPDATPSNPRLLRPLLDGSMILVDERWNLSGSGVQQQEMELTRHDASGALVDSLGPLPFTRSIVVGSGGGTMVGSPIFSPSTSVAVAGNNLFVGEGSVPEVEVRASSGAVARRIRWPDDDRTVESEDVGQYLADMLEGIEDENERRQRREYFGSLPHEDVFPAYERILTDAAGGVWVEQFRRPGREGPRRWLVLDADGRTLGVVATPKRFRVLEIGDDYLLGVEPDELDVEHVRLYRILKPNQAE